MSERGKLTTVVVLPAVVSVHIFLYGCPSNANSYVSVAHFGQSGEIFAVASVLQSSGLEGGEIISTWYG